MTLLIAAVIVHDKAANCVVLLQRSQNAKFAQGGMWDRPVSKNEPGEPMTETAVRELREVIRPDGEGGVSQDRPHHPWRAVVGPSYLGAVTVLFTWPKAGFYAFVARALLGAGLAALFKGPGRGSGAYPRCSNKPMGRRSWLSR